jgi:hypothetical protein
MKRITLFLFAITVAVGVNAQESQRAKSPEERSEQMTEKMATELNLSADQKASIDAINTKYIMELRAVRDDASKTEDAKKEEHKAIRQNWKKEVGDQLTEDQKKRLAELKEERKEQKGEHLSLEERARKKTDHMTEHLGLSEEQEEQVYQLNLKVGQKIKAIKDNPEMSEEKKKEFIQGNRKDFKTVLTSILTAEQMEKFEAMKKEHHSEEEQD